MLEHNTGNYKDQKYFSTTRNYTLALLNAFNNIQYWVDNESEQNQKEFTVPISFGNYEKAIELEDLNDETIKKGNFNFLPRLVLSFNGMSKNTDRQTNKFRKFSEPVCIPEHKETINASYNSLSYDYTFTLLLQTRGLNIATQITEEILIKFNPTLNLLIKEFPLFDETETQILISDPSFEINEEFGPEEVNIINVSFDITLRGNIYSPIELNGFIQGVKLFVHLWNTKSYKDSKLASYYKFDVTESGTEQTARTFNGTVPWSPDVEKTEREVIQTRDDYKKHETKMISENNLPECEEK